VDHRNENRGRAEQASGWTFEFLANHVWSVGGSGAQDISSTFLQPFLAHTTSDASTFTLNAESTYDWKHEQGRCRSS
jgi:hypothetical protein